MDDMNAQVPSDFLDYQYEVLGVREHMASAEVTEICINRPGEIYVENRHGWQRIEVPASAVGLEGSAVKSMSFSLYDGRVTWDQIGRNTLTQP